MLMTASVPAATFSQDDPPPIIIDIGEEPGDPNGNRSPVYVPIICYYYPSLSAVTACFQCSLDSVTVEIEKGLDAEFYFARPYHSWERGANENTNGLIRQYIPKGTDFSKLTDEMLAEIEWKLNHRPRKSLGYRTPWEYCKQLFNFDF